MTLPGHLADPNFRYSVNEYTGDGSTTQWSFSFDGGYIARDHVGAYSIADDGSFNELPITWVGDNQIQISPAVAAGRKFRIYRSTPLDSPLVDFADGAFINEKNLDLNSVQAVLVAAETRDAAVVANKDSLALAAQSKASSDAAAASASTAVASAGTSTAQAGIATAKAGEAAASATSASGSAGTATTQAGIATTKAGEAAGSASAASTAAGTATTQAGIATTQAGIATTQAGNVAAAIASVPIGAGSSIAGSGPPGFNVGTTGAFYTDGTTGSIYGPKTAAGWSSTPIAQMVPSGPQQPSRKRADFLSPGAVLPPEHWTFTRAQSRTDLLYSDSYDYLYSTYGPNVPVIRAGKGLGVWQAAQQMLANPAAPVTETITLNNTGVYIVTCWGPPGSALGAAFATGTGTITDAGLTAASSLAGNAKSFLIITMTSTGTVIFTPSGGLTKANVTINPNGATLSQPVPFIPTQSTVNADFIAGNATFNSLIGAARGYFLVGVAGVTGAKNYARLPGPLGLNGFTAAYIASDTTYNFFDAAGHSLNNNSVGNASFSAGLVMGRTWDTGQANVSFGAGDKSVGSFGFAHNNGAAVTASCLGGAATTGTYANYAQINGWITFYEIATDARLTDAALYQKYSSWAAPAPTTVLHNFSPISISKWRRGLAQMAAGLRDCVLCIVASSHGAGQYPTNDPKRNCWSWQLATKLTAAGIQAWPYAYCGDDQYTIPASGGTSLYDPYVSFSAGWSKSGSRRHQFGGDVVLTTTTGATFTHAIPPATDTYTITAYQGPGYGSFTVAANGGAVLATVNLDNPTLGEKVTTVTVPAGVNSFTITVTSTGSKPVKIARSLPNDSRFKKVLIYNGARSAANSADLSNNIAPENSYLLGLTNLTPDLTIIQGTVTNSASAAESAATFTSNMLAVYTAAAQSGSVIMMDDPASSIAVVSPANQALYRNLDATIAYDKGVPFLSAYEISSYELGNARGLYGDTVHGSALSNSIIADNVAYALTA